MYSFRNDYGEGAHPRILKALSACNGNQEEGYGLDRHSQRAKTLLRDQLDDPDAEIHLLPGGTQTNLIAISGFLRPHEACITAASGHIAVHETGAIEATGHKLLPIESDNGKITPGHIEPVLRAHHFEHMVKPRLVYISNPTELGTVYSLGELEALFRYCHRNDLLLYADGARLGAALVCGESELSLAKIYRLTDAFFIGATKIGALLGEALVISNPQLRADFRYLIKQRGGLLAKGRVLGIQFEELFRDGLYFDLARHANSMAQTMARELADMGCEFWIDSPTNQIFPIMDEQKISRLAEHFQFYTWKKVSETHAAVRLVTSWATPESAIRNFLDAYRQLCTETASERSTKKCKRPATIP